MRESQATMNLSREQSKAARLAERIERFRKSVYVLRLAAHDVTVDGEVGDALSAMADFEEAEAYVLASEVMDGRLSRALERIGGLREAVNGMRLLTCEDLDAFVSNALSFLADAQEAELDATAADARALCTH